MILIVSDMKVPAHAIFSRWSVNHRENCRVQSFFRNICHSTNLKVTFSSPSLFSCNMWTIKTKARYSWVDLTPQVSALSCERGKSHQNWRWQRGQRQSTKGEYRVGEGERGDDYINYRRLSIYISIAFCCQGNFRKIQKPSCLCSLIIFISTSWKQTTLYFVFR